jgi:hypothetical protein
MLPKYVTRVETVRDELNVYVKSEHIENVMMFLRDHTSCQFRQMVDMTAVDYPTRPERFELSYMLLSHRYNYRIRVKTAVDELTALDTTSFVHPAANWCVAVNPCVCCGGLSHAIFVPIQVRARVLRHVWCALHQPPRHATVCWFR